MTPLSPGEMCAGKEGSLPDFTMVMSSVCVCAVENGDLQCMVSKPISFESCTYASAHISNTRHPKLHMSDLVSYRFSARISGGIYSGVCEFVSKRSIVVWLTPT